MRRYSAAEGFKDPDRVWYKSRTRKLLLPYKTDRGENIVILQGGKFRLPDDKRAEFLQTYASECTRFNFSIVEYRSEVFPFLADFDHIGPAALDMGDSLWTEMQAHLVAAIRATVEVTEEAATAI